MQARALSQIAGGNRFSAGKAWRAAANGAIVGAARGALIGSGAGIPLAFGVDFAAGMAGSLAEQKIASGRIAPVRAVVDGVFNAAGGRLYGTSPLKNARNAFIRGALEGAVKGDAYNIADVLDNKLRNARRKRQKTGRNPYAPTGAHPSIGRSPQQICERQRPLNGMQYPNRGGSIPSGDDKFRLGDFLWDTISGAVLGGLAGVAFYGVDKAADALKRSALQSYIPVQNERIARGKKPLIEYDLQFFAEKNKKDYSKLRNTKNIRYSQKSINPYFDNGNNVNELIAYLKAEPLYARKVDPIRLVKFRNLPLDVQKILKLQGVSSFTVFSLDNRRLYAAKMAGAKVNSRWITQQELADFNLIRRFSTVTGEKIYR